MAKRRPLIFFKNSIDPYRHSSRRKYDELYRREMEEFAAENQLKKRMSLLKTDRAKLAYLDAIIRESEKRGSGARNVLRRIGAATERSYVPGAGFVSEVARAFEGGKPALVSRPIDSKIRAERARLSRKMEAAESRRVARAIARHERLPLETEPVSGAEAGAAQERQKRKSRPREFKERYLKRLAASESFASKSYAEKISYLKEMAAKRPRSSLAESEIRREIERLTKASQRKEAGALKVRAKDPLELMSLAMGMSNPEARKKFIRRAKAILLAQGKPVPPEADYIAKYGKLSPLETERAREFEIAKVKGDVFLAAKALKGMRFKADEMYDYADALRRSGQSVKAAIFFIELGFETEAERIARALERKGDAKGAMGAMNIRKRMKP